ncbi:MAG: hypothetical protein LCH63_19990 [Candidatus Melainabacteria bacterium]|nr:hypothetical protein [Candidatus Melainabacteria bacterium]OPZ87581.1 MAG: hypothetical protein BWY75_01843 [bacterium ADurb.Bin425]
MEKVSGAASAGAVSEITSSETKTAQVTIVGDQPSVLALAELLASEHSSYRITARIITGLFEGQSKLNSLRAVKRHLAARLNEEALEDAKRHSRSLSSWTGRIGLGGLADGLDSPARVLLSLADAARTASGLAADEHIEQSIDAVSVLRRENVLVQNLEEFDDDPGRDYSQSFIFACSSSAYAASLDLLYPYITEGSTVILLGAPLFAALEFKHQLALRAGRQIQVNVLEMDFPFAAVSGEIDTAIKTVSCLRANVAAGSLNETRRSLWLASQLCSEVIPASGLIERALLDVHSILRPVFILSALLGGRVESLGDLSRLLNRANLSLIVQIEQELTALAQAVRCRPVDFAAALREEVDGRETQGPVCDVTLAEAIVSIGGTWFAAQKNWSYSFAQETLSRYVGEFLVPLTQLGQMVGVRVPSIESMVVMAASVGASELAGSTRQLDTNTVGLPREALTDLALSRGLGF